jgi:hypothetical protein
MVAYIGSTAPNGRASNTCLRPFPVPAILERQPTLIGYYRLLLGISQKRLYRKGAEMGPFKSMESRDYSILRGGRI